MIEGLAHVISLNNLPWLLLGILDGFIFGILPGLGQGTALIMLFPLSFFLPPEVAFIPFASLLGATTMGDAVTSILLNTPGSAATLTTQMDGYPMTRKGEAARALGLAAGSSLLGGVFGAVVLAACIPLVRSILMSVGNREFFWLIVMAFIIIALATAGGGFLKGLVSILLGLMLSLTGFSEEFGVERYTLGTKYLWEGFPVVTTLMGLFAMSEFVMILAGGKNIAQDKELKNTSRRQTFAGMCEAARCWITWLRSSVIGTIVGIIPGIGGSVACYLSYSATTMLERKPLPAFGQGNRLGVIASQAATSAKDGGAMLPLLFFGIPGSPEGAILLPIFVVLGLQPGPGMALQHLSLVWVIIFCIVIGNMFGAAIIGFGGSWLSKITFINGGIVVAICTPLALTASFVGRGNLWDNVMIAAFMVLGLLLKRSGYPVAPAIIGYVLGPLLEHAFFVTFQSGYNKPSAFFTTWLAIVLAIICFLLVLMPLVMGWRLRGRGGIRSQNLNRAAPLEGATVAASASSKSGEVSRGGAVGRVNTTFLHSGRTATEESTGASAPERASAPQIRFETVYFAAGLLLVSALYALYAISYGTADAGLLPLICGVAATLLLSMILWSELRPGFSRRLQQVLGPFGRAGESRLEEGWGRLIPALVWVSAYIAGAMLVGHLTASLLFVFLCLWIRVRLSWKRSAVTAIVTGAVIYVLFAIVFKTSLWPGAIPTVIHGILGGGAVPPF